MLLPGPEGIAAARERALAREFGAAVDESRFERMGNAFQVAVDAAFRKLVALHPERCIAVDADGSIEDVERRIDAVMLPLVAFMADASIAAAAREEAAEIGEDRSFG
jgi:thymidylate kinase